jgi:hypothetical protein
MTAWFTRYRIVVGVVAMVLVLLGGVTYVVWTSQSQAAPGRGAATTTGLIYVDHSGGRDQVARIDPGGKVSFESLRCQRVYTAAGTTICLRLAGPGPSYEAAIVNARGAVIRTVGLPGVPSRARVSASGQIVSWTVFVVGDSYSTPGGFSTRTGYVNLKTGEKMDSLEPFTVLIDGKAEKKADFNFWGMTVATDDRTFYATLGSGDKTWLIRGDLDTHRAETVRPGAECPSLSPDQTRVAYKKRTGRLGQWQLVVLTLASGVETTLPGSLGIDDQAAWLNNTTLAYGKPASSGGSPTIYASDANGSGQPKVLVNDASSPSPPGN